MELKRINSVRFDELTHCYLCGDKLLVGVTTLMKHQGLSPDYGGIDEKVLQDAAKRGTAVHTMLEQFDNKETVIPCDVLSDNYEGKILQTRAEQTKILNAYSKLGLKVLCSEYLVSDESIVASFIDKVFEDFSLADVKTTATLHIESVSWQLSIYAYLFERQNPDIKVPHLYAIHIRNGAAKLIEVPRQPNEEVAEVLRCEEFGLVYAKKGAQDASVALTDSEVLALTQAETQLAAYDVAIKAIKAQSDAIKDKLYQYMLANNIDELSCPGGAFKLKRPYEKSSIDTKTLKSKYPDIAEKLTVVSEVKGNVSYKSTSNE